MPNPRACKYLHLVILLLGGRAPQCTPSLKSMATTILAPDSALQRFSKRLALPKIENTSQQDLRLGLSLEIAHSERIFRIFFLYLTSLESIQGYRRPNGVYELSSRHCEVSSRSSAPLTLKRCSETK